MLTDLSAMLISLLFANSMLIVIALNWQNFLISFIKTSACHLRLTTPLSMLAMPLKWLVAIAILRPLRSEIKQHYLRCATLSILATVQKHLVGMAIFEFRPTAIGRWRF